MRTNRPPHLATFDYLGLHRYFLTFCTHQRHHAFSTKDRVELTRTQIVRVATEQRFAISAYCFMLDHLHILVEGQADDSDCRAFIARAKQFSGYHYQQTFGERLWQRFGYERTLRSTEATLAVARYIFENPIRASLVARVEDYPYLGSEVYCVGEVLDAVQWKP